MEKHYNPFILIVDDEEAILKTLQQALEDESYRVQTLQDGNKTLDLIGKLIPDLVLLDIFMPNCNGMKLLSQIKKEYPHQKVIMISGHGNIPLAIEALKNGAQDFIEKPLSLDDILPKIAAIKEQGPSPITNPAISFKLAQDEFVGESYTFQELINQASRITSFLYPCIIYGQPGTGKSTLAHFIHKRSPFSDKPWITIHCSRLKELEQQKNIELAFKQNNNTLFLKHIEYLSPDNQTLLLSLLEKNKDSCLRIIASTCTSLYVLSKSGKFNPFLFYHLNVIPLEIPPLNKHQYDIPLLINYFLTKANIKCGKSVILSSSALRQLRNYQWPGNILELQTIIDRIVLLAQVSDQVITPSMLVSIMGEKNTQIIEEQSFTSFCSLEEATTTFEKNFLLYLLKKNHYNLEQVSHRLSITPIQLRNKLLELNIETKGVS